MNMRNASIALVSFFALAALLGCGGMQTTAPPAVISSAAVSMPGLLMGGRQPIGGAQVDVWEAGTSGYGALSSARNTPLGTTTSGSNGTFNIGPIITAFNCADGGSQQLYLTASGGNPGLAGGGTAVSNSDAVLMVALGPCSGVNAANMPYLNVSERSTVAAVWALAPFMANTSVTATNKPGIAVGTSATNTAGMATAFADAVMLVPIGTAQPTTSTSTVTYPVTEINTLADILAACVNSDPGGSSTCSTLFGYTTVNGTTPANILQAALNIAINPSQNATNLNNMATPISPYQPVLTSVTDFTLAVTYTGSAIIAPTAVALDGSGNVWIANSGSTSVTELQHNGTVLSGTNGYTGAGSLSGPSAIAIDASGNAWITNAGNSTLTELTSTGTNAPGSPFSGGNLSTPSGLSFDTLNDLWISNSGNSDLTLLSPGSSSLNSGPAVTGVASPVAVAISTQ